MNRHTRTNTEIQPEGWDEVIAELEHYFGSIPLIPHPIKINRYTTIIDMKKFIENNLVTIKMYKGKRIGLPYLHRLQEFKRHLIFIGYSENSRDG